MNLHGKRSPVQLWTESPTQRGGSPGTEVKIKESETAGHAHLALTSPGIKHKKWRLACLPHMVLFQ